MLETQPGLGTPFLLRHVPRGWRGPPTPVSTVPGDHITFLLTGLRNSILQNYPDEVFLINPLSIQ